MADRCGKANAGQTQLVPRGEDGIKPGKPAAPARHSTAPPMPSGRLRGHGPSIPKTTLRVRGAGTGAEA